MKSLLAAAFLAATMSTVAHAGECKPVDKTKIAPSQAAGMKAWIYDPVNTRIFSSPSEWPKADLYVAVGPGNFALDSKLGRLDYGQQVEIVEWQQANTASGGVYKVKLPDGTFRFVTGQSVQFFEFWNCPAATLLEKHPSGISGVGDVQALRSTWGRISNPKATAVDDRRQWVPEEKLAGYAFVICDYYEPNIKRFYSWQEPLRCMGFSPDHRGGMSFYIEPSAVETISPTSMKILFAS
jgi:hypothetical protein